MDAPADVRVEAGYNLGVDPRAHRRRTRPRRSGGTTSWTPFLVRPGGPQGLGPKGRWWVARTLLDVGSNLYEQQGRVEEAKRAWLLVVDSGLPGAEFARERLARFHLPAAKP